MQKKDSGETLIWVISAHKTCDQMVFKETILHQKLNFLQLYYSFTFLSFKMRLTLLASVAAIATAVSAAPFEKRAVKAKVYTTCSVPGTMALTFDDGPYEYTWALAETLHEKGVTATFFMNGNNWV